WRDAGIVVARRLADRSAPWSTSGWQDLVSFTAPARPSGHRGSLARCHREGRVRRLEYTTTPCGLCHYPPTLCHYPPTMTAANRRGGWVCGTYERGGWWMAPGGHR